MNKRQEKILAAVVQDYTASATPVGSNVLAEKYGFDVSPATLRNDMAELESDGFLYQPHVSAGRIPTDKGYRYFVEKIMEDRELTKGEQQKLQAELLQLKAKNARLTRTAAKLLSALSGAVAVSGLPARDEFYEFGLSALLEEAEKENLDDLCRLAQALDYIDERCDVLLGELHSDETKIFIGTENPIDEMSRYAMIVSPYHRRDGERGIIALIGPKNMRYEKNKSLIEYMKKILGSAGVVMFIIMI